MQTFTTKVAAEAAGVHQQTVIRYALTGFLKPSVPRQKWEPRKYTERDLAALMIARAGFSVGLSHEDVAEMVKMAQKSNETQQKNAAMVTVKGFNGFAGFVHMYWFSNTSDRAPAELIEMCDERGLILQQVSLYDIMESMGTTVFKKHVRHRLDGIDEDEQEKALDEINSEVKAELTELEAELAELEAKLKEAKG